MQDSPHVVLVARGANVWQEEEEARLAAGQMPAFFVRKVQSSTRHISLYPAIVLPCP